MPDRLDRSAASDLPADRLLGFDTATLYEANGRRGAVSSEIHAVWSPARAVGRAVPVRCGIGDNLAIHRAVARAGVGDVLVVDAGGQVAGYWGEVLTIAAQVRGIAGLVIDGGCRDREAIERLGFPVWARGVSILGCDKQDPGSVGEPIVCGSVRVGPGDYVVGDGDGVVILSAADLAGVLEGAEARVAKERELANRLRAGDVTLDLLSLRGILSDAGLQE